MSVIVTTNREEKVPTNYVKCSKEEALQSQWLLIRTWKPVSDVWPFRYGLGALSISGAISGGLIASYFRRKLKLEHYGRVAMLLPTMGMPGAFSPLIHSSFVSEPILLQSECPICLQVRAMVIQNLVGIGYPLVISSATGFHLAIRYSTFMLPEFSMKAIPQFYNTALNLIRYRMHRIGVLSIINSLIAGFITEREANSLYTIAYKLDEEINKEAGS